MRQTQPLLRRAPALVVAAAFLPVSVNGAPAGAPACKGDAGLQLPPGFCASVFADHLGHARHLVVSPGNVVYVNTWSGRHYHYDTPHEGGFLVALEDTSGSGAANGNERFGETAQQGGTGGTGIALYRGALYVEMNDRIERYALTAGSIVPQGRPETIVSGLPMGGDHPMHPFVIDAEGALYVDVASATNACQQRNRTPGSPGISSCRELRTRGGIWRYDANRTGQKFSPRERYATGIRNAEGLAFDFDASGRALYATQHGRDQLHQGWPALYPPEHEATQPAEELLRIRQGGDYGWPECYFDEVQGRLVLAPEYGGDGGKTVGRCAGKLGPVASFPAHWAPNDLVIYTGESFPARYRHGAFIAFHGSWDRAPYAQGGYNIVYQPLSQGVASGRCEVFADGFAGAVKEPGRAEHRPSGVAVGPDGALYVSDDVHGRIYRIVYLGGGADAVAGSFAPCPPVDAPAGPIVAATAAPPEGLHENAGRAAAAGGTLRLPVPKGSSREMVALGEQIFHGQAAQAACTGCHGADGAGTSQGPSLLGNTWLWSDGSLEGIARTIHDGVPNPRKYPGVMPPMGGAQLTSEQLSAVAAYVWALGHSER